MGLKPGAVRVEVMAHLPLLKRVFAGPSQRRCDARHKAKILRKRRCFKPNTHLSGRPPAARMRSIKRKVCAGSDRQASRTTGTANQSGEGGDSAPVPTPSASGADGPYPSRSADRVGRPEPGPVISSSSAQKYCARYSDESPKSGHASAVLALALALKPIKTKAHRADLTITIPLPIKGPSRPPTDPNGTGNWGVTSRCRIEYEAARSRAHAF